MRRTIIALSLLAASLATASAQTSPNFTYGQVPTTAQWNALFAGKMDYPGGPTLLLSGGTMTGPLVTAASLTGAAGFNIAPGVAPTSPNNGDLWVTGAGLFVQVNGVTVGPLASTSSTVAQEINLNSAALPAKQTGTILQIGQANGVTGRLEIDAFAAAPRLTFVREDGTAASPTALLSGDEIGSLNSFGYNGSLIVGPQAAIRTYAAQNWAAGSAYGTYMRFGVTANGATALADALGIEQDGGVTVGSTVGTSAGPGTINLGSGGGLFLNGTAAVTTINGTGCALFGFCSITATAASVTIGSTVVVSGTPNGLLYDAAGIIGNLATANSGVLVTSSGGVPSISSTLPTAVQTNITELGTVTVGVWNGSAISATYLPTATSAALGLVQGDGSTLPISAGVMHCVTATTSQIGCAKPDGSTIVISSGVLTAIGAAAASITVGITTVGSGTTGYVLENNGGTLGNATIASFLTAGAGIAITGTTNATIALAFNGAILQASPSNPTGTSTTQKMAGLGTTCKITPVNSTRVQITFYGQLSNNTASALAEAVTTYGTGTAPSNGAALTGTQVGSQVAGNANIAGWRTPFSIGGIITGLTVGTPYWFDLAVSTGTSGATANVLGPTCTAQEVY